MDLSQYFCESFFYTFYESDRLKFTISNEMLPAAYANMFTTTSLENLLPGLVAKYGDNMPMAIEISAESAPRTIFTEGDMGGSLDLGFNFIVEGQGSAVMLDFLNAAAMVQVNLEDFLLYLNIESVNILTVEEVSSNIGEIDTKELMDFVTLTIKMTLPVINRMLKHGIPIP